MSAQKYYLRVNGNIIIDLKDYRKYGDMTEFTSLALFTSDYDSIYDIGEELKRVGLLRKETIIDTMEIVRMYNNRFYPSSSSPLLKGDYPYFDTRVVKSFFSKNKQFYEELGTIISVSKRRLLRRIGRTSENKSHKDNYILILEKILFNIERLEVVIDGLQNNDISLYQEYVKRINDYVDSEIFNGTGIRRSINYKGLFEMAKLIHDALASYPYLYMPSFNTVKKDKRIAAQHIHKEEMIDPDKYMFLEDEDFISLNNGRNTEAIETQIENLAEKKKRL